MSDRHPKELGITEFSPQTMKVLPLERVANALAGKITEPNIRSIDVLSDDDLDDRLSQLIYARNFAKMLLGLSSDQIQETDATIQKQLQHEIAFQLKNKPPEQVIHILCSDKILISRAERAQTLAEFAIQLSVLEQVKNQTVTPQVLEKLYRDTEVPLSKIRERKRNHFSLNNFQNFEEKHGDEQNRLINEYILFTDGVPESSKKSLDLKHQNIDKSTTEQGRIRFGISLDLQTDPAFESNRLLLAIQCAQKTPDGRLSIRYPHINNKGNIVGITALVIDPQYISDIRTIARWADYRHKPFTQFNDGYQPQKRDYNKMTRRLAIIEDYVHLKMPGRSDLAEELKKIHQDWGSVNGGVWEPTNLDRVAAYQRMGNGLDSFEFKFFPRK